MRSVDTRNAAVWVKIKRSVLFGLLLFGLGEGGSRVWLHRVASDQAFLRFASWRQLDSRREQPSPLATAFAAHRYVGYLPAAGGVREPNRHSLSGFRGQELRADSGLRIVCVGGSEIYSVGVVDWRESFPAQLEQRLRELGHDGVEVINAGVPGWSSWEVLIDYSLRIDRLRPDLVIIGVAADDVDARIVWPAGTYKPDNSGWRARPVAPIWMPAFWEHSTLLRMVMIALDRIPSHASFERTLDAPVATAHARAFEREKVEGSYPQGVFEWAAASRMLHVNAPVYFERNLEQLVVLTQAAAARPMLLPLRNARDEADPRSSSSEYLTAYAEHDAVARRIAERYDIPLLLDGGDLPEGALNGLVWTAEGESWRAERVALAIDRQLRGDDGHGGQ
jgi:hypothetical protein